MIKQIVSERPVVPATILADDPKMTKKVYIVGGDGYVEKMFNSRGWAISRVLEDADLYVFTGGADITPELYGQKNVKSYTSASRDAKEVEFYNTLKGFRAPMVGICRGGQFLNVMNGGTMWQDVNNHTALHKMIIVEGHDDEGTILEEGREILVTSTHHQMMRPDIDGEILGVAVNQATFKTDDVGTVKEGDGKFDSVDVEVVYYPETSSLCFQPHPEYAWAPKECTDFFFELLEEKFSL